MDKLTIGIIAGIAIGYFVFKPKPKKNEHNTFIGKGNKGKEVSELQDVLQYFYTRPVDEPQKGCFNQKTHSQAMMLFGKTSWYQNNKVSDKTIKNFKQLIKNIETWKTKQ